MKDFGSGAEKIGSSLVRKSGDAAEFLKNLKNRPKEYNEDIEELHALSDVFLDIHKAAENLDKCKRKVEGMPSLKVSVLLDPEPVEEIVKVVNRNLNVLTASFQKIQKSKLRFGRKFMGQYLDELQLLIDQQSSWSMDFFHALAKVESKINRGSGLKNLSKELNEMQVNAEILRKQMSSVVDVSLEGYSNNRVLNKIIAVQKIANVPKKSYEDIKSDYEKYKQWYDLYQKIREYIP